MTPISTFHLCKLLDDPANATGTETQVMDIYRASRDDSHRRVADLIGIQSLIA